MFVISWVLVIGAAAALVAGIYEGGFTLIFIAIGGALASAVFLAAGVLRTRSVEPATAGGPFGPEEAAAPAERPAARKQTAKRTAVKRETAARRAAARVVAIPERGTYHEAGCRFVKARRDTDRITRATAKRRGYSACGVCKPG